MRAIAVVGLAVVLAGCGGSAEKDRVGREFSSMKQCIDFIQNDIREELHVASDKPGDVSGYSKPSRHFFRCELMRTGTRGTYLEGRWDRPKRSE